MKKLLIFIIFTLFYIYSFSQPLSFLGWEKNDIIKYLKKYGEVTELEIEYYFYAQDILDIKCIDKKDGTKYFITIDVETDKCIKVTLVVFSRYKEDKRKLFIDKLNNSDYYKVKYDELKVSYIFKHLDNTFTEMSIFKYSAKDYFIVTFQKTII